MEAVRRVIKVISIKLFNKCLTEINRILTAFSEAIQWFDFDVLCFNLHQHFLNILQYHSSMMVSPQGNFVFMTFLNQFFNQNSCMTNRHLSLHFRHKSLRVEF